MYILKYINAYMYQYIFYSLNENVKYFFFFVFEITFPCKIFNLILSFKYVHVNLVIGNFKFLIRITAGTSRTYISIEFMNFKREFCCSDCQPDQSIWLTIIGNIIMAIMYEHLYKTFFHCQLCDIDIFEFEMLLHCLIYHILSIF